jgi:hypothetical protein
MGVDIRHALISFFSASFIVAGVAVSAGAEIVPDCGNLSVGFEVNENINSAVYPSLPHDQQIDFQNRFCRQVSKLSSWLTGKGWIALDARPLPQRSTVGPYTPGTDIQVFVSNQYRISRALVPAWFAQRGRMEFPAKEVVAIQEAAAHELTHVFFPNGNRMLAEGLAVYTQFRLGTNPAFPNFGQNLHQMVKDFTCPDGDAPGGLDGIDLEKLDRIATPDQLWLRIGIYPYENAADVYPVAGSFVQFLIEEFGTFGPSDPVANRMAKFRELYMQTPLHPLQREPGPDERWQFIYGHPLKYIAEQWKSVIQGWQCSTEPANSSGKVRK